MRSAILVAMCLLVAACAQRVTDGNAQAYRSGVVPGMIDCGAEGAMERTPACRDIARMAIDWSR